MTLALGRAGNGRLPHPLPLQPLPPAPKFCFFVFGLGGALAVGTPRWQLPLVFGPYICALYACSPTSKRGLVQPPLCFGRRRWLHSSPRLLSGCCGLGGCLGVCGCLHEWTCARRAVGPYSPCAPCHCTRVVHDCSGSLVGAPCVTVHAIIKGWGWRDSLGQDRLAAPLVVARQTRTAGTLSPKLRF